MIYIHQVYMFSTIAKKDLFSIRTKSNMSQMQTRSNLWKQREYKIRSLNWYNQRRLELELAIVCFKTTSFPF